MWSETRLGGSQGQCTARSEVTKQVSRPGQSEELACLKFRYKRDSTAGRNCKATTVSGPQPRRPRQHGGDGPLTTCHTCTRQEPVLPLVHEPHLADLIGRTEKPPHSFPSAPSKTLLQPEALWHLSWRRPELSLCHLDAPPPPKWALQPWDPGFLTGCWERLNESSFTITCSGARRELNGGRTWRKGSHVRQSHAASPGARRQVTAKSSAQANAQGTRDPKRNGSVLQRRETLSFQEKATRLPPCMRGGRVHRRWGPPGSVG